MVPGGIPVGTLPGNMVPSNMMPGGPAPANMVPGGPAPANMVPGGPAPGGAIPGIPNASVPATQATVSTASQLPQPQQASFQSPPYQAPNSQMGFQGGPGTVTQPGPAASQSQQQHFPNSFPIQGRASSTVYISHIIHIGSKNVPALTHLLHCLFQSFCLKIHYVTSRDVIL